MIVLYLSIGSFILAAAQLVNRQTGEPANNFTE